jgi:ankyrin repeat protein
MGSLKMVEIILKYRVKGKMLKSCESTTQSLSGAESITAKKRISDSIHALMSRLNVNLKTDTATPAGNVNQTLSPVDVDIYCDHGTQTALHIAVKNKNFAIASLILVAGGNPNLTIYLNEEELSKLRSRTALDEYVFTGSTVLVEAVRHRDMGISFKSLTHILFALTL